MPEIPRFIIDRDAPGPGSVSIPTIRQEPRTISAAGGVGRSIAEAGSNIFEITERHLNESIKDRLELAGKEAKALETSIGLEAIFNSKLELANKAQELAAQDPINADENFKKFFKDFSANLTKSTKGLSIESRNVVFEKVGNDALGHSIKLRNVRTRAVVDRNLQVLNKAMEIQRTRYIESSDPQERTRIIDETQRLFRTSEFTGVSTRQAVKDRVTTFVENAEFERASTDLNRDPGTFLTKNVRREYPLIADANKYDTLLGRADQEFRRREKELEERSKAVRLALVDTLETKAVSGVLVDAELDSHVAKNEIDPEDAKKLRDLREGARIRRDTDPVVVAEFQREILENPSQEVKTQIIAHKNIASEKKLELVEQIKRLQTAQSDPNHFSKTPAFQFAKNEVNRAITGGGLLISVQEGERVANAQLELWNRVEKGEDPVKILPDIVKRWKRGPLPQVVGGPRFKTEDELAKALDKKFITNQEFIEEVNRLRSLDGGDTK